MSVKPPQGRIEYFIPALCACAEAHPGLLGEIYHVSQAVTDWTGVLRQAETHSLSPLLYHHLSAAGVALPTQVRRELMGVSLQLARANQIRAAALGEVLAVLENTGIRALVLKGAALAHQVYPQPGLRPMRDLDILVAPGDLAQAQSLLLQLGYLPEPSELITAGHHHLTPLARTQQGLHVSLEIHHQLFPSTRHYQPLGYKELAGRAVSFRLYEQTAFTLAPEDMLWHIYRHAAGPPLLTIPLKLIYVADLTSIVRKSAPEIDWDRLRQRYPQLLRVLPLLHFLTPWPAEIVQRFGWDLSNPPAGIGAEFSGWPRFPWTGPARLRATFSPPEWWLRFFYGVGCEAPLSYAWHRWVRHPFHILEWGVSTGLQALRDREFSFRVNHKRI